jgi:hypothetical protein
MTEVRVKGNGYRKRWIDIASIYGGHRNIVCNSNSRGNFLGLLCYLDKNDRDLDRQLITQPISHTIIRPVQTVKADIKL